MHHQCERAFEEKGIAIDPEHIRIGAFGKDRPIVGRRDRHCGERIARNIDGLTVHHPQDDVGDLRYY